MASILEAHGVSGEQFARYSKKSDLNSENRADLDSFEFDANRILLISIRFDSYGIPQVMASILEAHGVSGEHLWDIAES